MDEVWSFEGRRAWFSSTVLDIIKSHWENNGGVIVDSIDESSFVFSDVYEDPMIQEYMLTKPITVFHSNFIVECVAKQYFANLGKYVLGKKDYNFLTERVIRAKDKTSSDDSGKSDASSATKRSAALISGSNNDVESDIERERKRAQRKQIKRILKKEAKRRSSQEDKKRARSDDEENDEEKDEDEAEEQEEQEEVEESEPDTKKKRRKSKTKMGKLLARKRAVQKSDSEEEVEEASESSPSGEQGDETEGNGDDASGSLDTQQSFEGSGAADEQENTSERESGESGVESESSVSTSSTPGRIARRRSTKPRPQIQPEVHTTDESDQESDDGGGEDLDDLRKRVIENERRRKRKQERDAKRKNVKTFSTKTRQKATGRVEVEIEDAKMGVEDEWTKKQDIKIRLEMCGVTTSAEKNDIVKKLALGFNKSIKAVQERIKIVC